MNTPIIVINPTVDELFNLKTKFGIDDSDIGIINNVSTMEEFVEAITSGGLISLSNNISLSGFSIPAGVTAVINLNGKTLSSSTDVSNMDKTNPIYDFVLEGNVTIKNGSLNVVGIENKGTLNLDNVSITKESNYGAAIKNTAGATLVTDENTTITVNAIGSATDTSGAACIRSFGNLTVNGSTFNSLSMRTYAIISNGTTIMNDASINGVHGAWACDAGNATIKDGDYTSNRHYGLYTSNDVAGSTVDVYGGTFKGGPMGNNTSVLVGSDDNEAVDSYVNIYGGKFYGNIKNQKNVKDTYGVKIYGGLFENKPADELIAEGYSCSEEQNSDGFYTVTKNN